MGRRAEGWKLILDRRSGVYNVRWTQGSVRYCRSTGERDLAAALRLAPSIYARKVAGREPSNVRGRIYFVQAGEDGAIKIGFAQNLESRLAAMRTDSPVALRLLASIPGTLMLEKKLHKRFAAAWLHGEWFSPSDDLLAHVRRLEAP